MKDCNRCGLKHSSYCIGCSNAKEGLGLSDKEYTDYLKSQDVDIKKESQNSSSQR